MISKKGRNLEKNDKPLIENHHNGYMTQRSNKSKLYDEADAKYPWSNYKRKWGRAMEKKSINLLQSYNLRENGYIKWFTDSM